AFEESDDRVTLMTMHAAKGLEFPRVFVIAVEDELLPHRRSRESEDQIEEERRLLFVAITRAMEWLQLSFCKRRNVRGEGRPVIASPFLTELPREDLRMVESEAKRDFFDQDEFDSVDYPDSWDLPEVSSDEDAEESPISTMADEEICQLPDDERNEGGGANGGLVREGSASRDGKWASGSRTRPRKSKLSAAAGLKTGADLLSAGATPLGAYREGVLVRHVKYGDGTIVGVSGRGPKRSVRVQFEDEETSFLIAYAAEDLSLVDP
ncbi:MAG: ATP-dependent helicase, partial [Planctomycetota bacterium]